MSWLPRNRGILKHCGVATCTCMLALYFLSRTWTMAWDTWYETVHLWCGVESGAVRVNFSTRDRSEDIWSAPGTCAYVYPNQGADSWWIPRFKLFTQPGSSALDVFLTIPLWIPLGLFLLPTVYLLYR